MSGPLRFYEKKFPETDELVVVKVKSIAEMGVYVSLLEYGNIEGMILLSEVSRKRIRSITKLIRVGRTEVVVVLRVDPEKGYIDLSKRRVNPQDVKQYEERYNKGKYVISIMRHLADLEKVDPNDLMESIAYPLYKKTPGVHAYDQLKLLLTDPDSVLKGIKFSKPSIRKTLIDIVKKKLKPKPIKLRADFACTCFTYEGIDAIKEALAAGKKHGTKQSPIKLTLLAPPLYIMTLTTTDKNGGMKILNDAIATIKKTLEKYKGKLTIKQEPRVVSAQDDHSLLLLMDQLKKQNQEVSGDQE